MLPPGDLGTSRPSGVSPASHPATQEHARTPSSRAPAIQGHTYPHAHTHTHTHRPSSHTRMYARAHTHPHHPSSHTHTSNPPTHLNTPTHPHKHTTHTHTHTTHASKSKELQSGQDDCDPYTPLPLPSTPPLDPCLSLSVPWTPRLRPLDPPPPHTITGAQRAMRRHDCDSVVRNYTACHQGLALTLQRRPHSVGLRLQRRPCSERHSAVSAVRGCSAVRGNSAVEAL